MTVNELIEELEACKQYAIGNFDVTINGKPIARVVMNSDEVVIESEESTDE